VGELIGQPLISFCPSGEVLIRAQGDHRRAAPRATQTAVTGRTQGRTPPRCNKPSQRIPTSARNHDPSGRQSPSRPEGIEIAPAPSTFFRRAATAKRMLSALRAVFSFYFHSLLPPFPFSFFFLISSPPACRKSTAFAGDGRHGDLSVGSDRTALELSWSPSRSDATPRLCALPALSLQHGHLSPRVGRTSPEGPMELAPASPS